MKTALSLQTLGNCRVAFQAFGIAGLLADFMAGQALGYALKLRVRTRKRAR